MSDIAYYSNCFKSLRRDRKYGGAPHKPILILSIIGLYKKQLISDGCIYITPELVSSFKKLWSKLVVSEKHTCNFALPFYHMSSEPFWTLIPSISARNSVFSKSQLRSFKKLNEAIAYAKIDEDLNSLLLDDLNRVFLKQELLNIYFPETKGNFNEDGLFSEENLLKDDSEEYISKIKILQQTLDKDSFDEEVFVRSGLFKREIPKIYGNMCAISKMKVDVVENISMLDACHIVPFSEAYNDSLTNGISLCPNLHRAFDRGLIAIDDTYRVLINNNFIENKSSSYNLTQYEGRQIVLPDNPNYHPSPKSLYHHRERFGFI